MQKGRNDFMRLKAWLLRHQVPIWGEGVAPNVFFLALLPGVCGRVLGGRDQKEVPVTF